jgi:hypothetical protein
MYRLLPYNDDCVLDIETNTLLFENDKEYKDFLVWKENSKEEYDLEVLKKESLLRHNNGEPHELILKTKTIKSTYAPNGQLVLKETYKEGVLVESEAYTVTGEPYTRVESKIWERVKYKDSKPSEIINYHTNGNKLRETLLSEYKGRYYKSISNHKESGAATEIHYYVSDDGVDYELEKHTTLNDIGNRISEVWYEDEYVKSSINYYAELEDGLVQSTYQHNKSDVDYVEYYTSKQMRAKGKFNLTSTMIGKWSFFHSNSIKESEIWLKDGVVVKAYTYHEDGTPLNWIGV